MGRRVNEAPGKPVPLRELCCTLFVEHFHIFDVCTGVKLSLEGRNMTWITAGYYDDTYPKSRERFGSTLSALAAVLG